MHDENNGIYVGSKSTIYLTMRENIILGLLIKNKGKMVSFEEIAKTIYGYKIDKYLKSNISTTISRLREKGKGEFKIFNRRGFGYFIV